MLQSWWQLFNCQVSYAQMEPAISGLESSKHTLLMHRCCLSQYLLAFENEWIYGPKLYKPQKGATATELMFQLYKIITEVPAVTEQYQLELKLINSRLVWTLLRWWFDALCRRVSLTFLSAFNLLPPIQPTFFFFPLFKFPPSWISPQRTMRCDVHIQSIPFDWKQREFSEMTPRLLHRWHLTEWLQKCPWGLLKMFCRFANVPMGGRSTVV